MSCCGGKKDVEKGGEEVQAKQYFHNLEVAAVAEFYNVDTTNGLSDEEVQARLEKYGYNKLTEKKKTTLLERIWRQLNNVLVFILIVVAIISAIKAATSTSSEDILTGWVEVGLILLVIIVNTFIGIYQEGSAEKSAEALKALLSANATVIRGGEKKEIPAEQLVPGDIVELSTGDSIPADSRLIKVSNFSCQEASLTGESVPVNKVITPIESPNGPQAVALGDRKNLAFSATLVTHGKAIGIVIATGDNTEIGTINALVGQVEAKRTNVLIQLDMVSKYIALFVLIVAIATFLVAYLSAGEKPMDAVSTALVTSVAMIPEGLAAIVTLTFSFAVNNMAKHHAIVRVLPAVETLGSVTVICSDKTGTLTKNEMTMVAMITSAHRYRFNSENKERTMENFIEDDDYMLDEKDKKVKESAVSVQVEKPQDESNDHERLKNVLLGAVLCSHAALGKDGGRDGEIGNPTELAIVRAAYFGGMHVNDVRKEQPIVHEVPFSSEYKFMATYHHASGDEDFTIHVKGAPDRMIALSSHQACDGDLSKLEPIDRDYWNHQAKTLGTKGLRVLAICRGTCKKEEEDHAKMVEPSFIKRSEPWLTLIGLFAIMDPPRPECVEAIKVAHRAGVRVAMITGDHQDTALAIGGMLGLTKKGYKGSVTGPQMDAMNEDELRVAVMKNNIFARASPENKIQIVKALQAEKQVCSMTGDGVNDAPALKAADIGVSMGLEGTDVAREASEIILTDDNFATIVAACEEGRIVWSNLRKILLFNTIVNNSQGLTVFFGMVTGLEFSPLTPIQVLYCNLICAVTLGMVLAVEPGEKGIMDEPPRKVGKRLIGRFLLLRIAIGTVVLVTCTVGAVWILINVGARNPSKNYTQNDIHSQASNTLTFGAISVALSARFSILPAIHPRILFGNKYCWYSVFLVAILQVAITYIPGLNNIVFQMDPMDGIQWAIVIGMMLVVLVCMEIEKTILRTLKRRGVDTEDVELDPTFDDVNESTLVQSGDGVGAASTEATLVKETPSVQDQVLAKTEETPATEAAAPAAAESATSIKEATPTQEQASS